jgi:hypothetical protein
MIMKKYVSPLKLNISPTGAFRFQERDGDILNALQQYDGVLARRHMKQMFWSQRSWRTMDYRLAKLVQNEYLARPTLQQRRLHPIPEPVLWLGWRGILYVANQYGLEIDPLKKGNENQLRSLERRLREAGVHWQREPRWSQLAHDLAVVDFRIAIEGAVSSIPTLSLVTWIPESIFMSQMDVIEYEYKTSGGKNQKKKKGIRPDGYFEIVHLDRKEKGLPSKARFLLEVDYSTHPLNRFSREKISAGLAYVRSSEYKIRFGSNSGRWLIVCKGEERMLNLKKAAEDVLGTDAGFFYFTTLEQINSKSAVNNSIWYCGNIDRAIGLFE